MIKLSPPKDSFQSIGAALLLGFLLAESFLFLEPIATRISELFANYCRPKYIFWFVQLSFFFLPFAVGFLNSTNNKFRFQKIVSSLRIDLLLCVVAGSAATFLFDGFFINPYRVWIYGLSSEQILICALIYLLIFAGAPFIQFLLFNWKKNERPPSIFIGDTAIEFASDDGLAFAEDAKRLAENIYNNGSSENLIFGIDAPWGTGKSSFLNLCKEHWLKKYPDAVIIYTFEPTRFQNRSDLLDKFVTGLIKKIKEYVFSPEIEPLFSKYRRLLKNPNVSIPFFGLTIELPFADESLEDVFQRLENSIQHLDRKIIIIIDDLDRLEFFEIKEVLYKIKNAFNLKNVSYVLCYDTKNLASLGSKVDEESHQSVIEFLEKYVNIKYNLYLDSKALSRYFTENAEMSLSKYPFANPELVSKASEGLVEIFNSLEFHNYLSFIGDIRKLKRLINVILLLEVEKTDFRNCDFNPRDLIHLLLIYINYPDIFRKIYYAETGGRYGFFSAVTKYDRDLYPNADDEKLTDRLLYKNSVLFHEYLETLSSDQKFLLRKVFDVSIILKPYQSSEVPQEILTSFACFNGAGWSGTKNLEEYIMLIIRMFRPEITNQHRFYLNNRDDFFSGIELKDILEKEEFSSEKTENHHEQFWRVIINAPSKNFDTEKSQKVINYLVQNLPKYPAIQDLGLRHSLIFYVAKLLDKIGWNDEDGGHEDNSQENVLSIARWIFGEDEFTPNGILFHMLAEERGVLGLEDALTFRLSCCRDRGGDLFNLSRALSIHANPNAPTSGRIREILIEQMREISQFVFAIFKKQYIDADKNIFAEIENLTEEQICGSWHHYYSRENNNDLILKIQRVKSTLRIFITYQLTNNVIDHGIGCGFYDESGINDQAGIRKTMNNYLFDRCFSSRSGEENYLYFLDFLLGNLSRQLHRGSFKYAPDIHEFLRILERERLEKYWRENSQNIKSGNFEKTGRILHTLNGDYPYKEYLPLLYQALDTLLTPSMPPSANE